MRAGIRRVLLATAVAGVATWTWGPAVAFGGTLDQQQATNWTDLTDGSPVIVCGNIAWAQTFTPGIGGQLDQVDLLVSRGSLTSDPLTVEIRSGLGNGAAGSALATGSIPAASVNTPDSNRAFSSATFGSPTYVAAGTQYAIVARTSSSCDADLSYNWANYFGTLAEPDPYAAGAPFFTIGGADADAGWAGWPGTVRPGDMGFKTYVVPGPPPPNPGGGGPGAGSGGSANGGPHGSAAGKCKKKKKKKRALIAKKKCKKKKKKK